VAYAEVLQVFSGPACFPAAIGAVHAYALSHRSPPPWWSIRPAF